MRNGKRHCSNCKKNKECKLQELFTDNKTGLLTCPDFRKIK